MRRFVTILLLLSADLIKSVTSIEAMFQGFNQCQGNNMLEYTLRVRKVNRTTAGLFGTINLKVEVGASYETAVEAFHSPLGNNQFNKYPMKIGPIRMCQFMENFWPDYYPYFADYVDNIQKPKECPISARLITFNDLILDGKMFPQVIPTGLWKVLWSARDTSDPEMSFVFEFVVKVYKEGFFKGKTLVLLSGKLCSGYQRLLGVIDWYE